MSKLVKFKTGVTSYEINKKSDPALSILHHISTGWKNYTGDSTTSTLVTKFYIAMAPTPDITLLDEQADRYLYYRRGKWSDPAAAHDPESLIRQTYHTLLGVATQNVKLDADQTIRYLYYEKTHDPDAKKDIDQTIRYRYYELYPTDPAAKDDSLMHARLNYYRSTLWKDSDWCKDKTLQVVISGLYESLELQVDEEVLNALFTTVGGMDLYNFSYHTFFVFKDAIIIERLAQLVKEVTPGLFGRMLLNIKDSNKRQKFMEFMKNLGVVEEPC